VIDGRYPPGSVFKTVTAAGALELGLHDADSKDFDYRSGELGPRRPDGIEHLGLWHRLELPDGPPIEGENHPHVHDWTFDLEQAFAYSCNIAFAEIGIELGATRLEQFAARFGFEQPLTVDGLGSSKSTLDGATGVGVTERYVGESASAVARTAFGQGEVLATPLQIALIPAAVANGGTIMQPRIVDGIRDEDGTWLSRDEPRVLHETGLSETTIDGLRRLMEASVTYGIADTASISSGNAGPGVAGKTGSAEWTEEKALPHSWFIGYFPTEAPRLAIAVVVEESGAGAQVAARIARHVFEARAVQDFLESSG
jgi:peptidoglycan glycosyltransferase